MHPLSLLLADGRFPSGGHVHSGGVEAACALGDITDVSTLETFVAARVATQGRVDASIAAWVCHRAANGSVPWTELDDEVAARIASPAVRQASRSQGRQLLRSAARIWDAPLLDAAIRAHRDGVFQPVALGVVGGVLGLDPLDAARVTLHHLVAGLVTAGIRLLGLDPFAVTAAQTRILTENETLLAHTAEVLEMPVSDLPATTSLLADVLAEHHATWEVRLFAS